MPGQFHHTHKNKAKFPCGKNAEHICLQLLLDEGFPVLGVLSCDTGLQEHRSPSRRCSAPLGWEKPADHTKMGLELLLC